MKCTKTHYLMFSLLAVAVIVAVTGPEQAMLFAGFDWSHAAGGLMMANAVTAADFEALQDAFNKFKDANDERWKEAARKGHADPLLETKVNKANEAVEKALKGFENIEAERKATQARMDAFEATIKRLSNLGGSAARVEAKTLEAYALLYGMEAGTEVNFVEHKNAVRIAMRSGDMAKVTEFEGKAMSVDSNPDGGFWVMPDTSGRIVSKIFESSPMRQYANVQGISTDALEGDYDLDEAGSGWVSERGARNETTTPQVGQWRIPTHELYAEPRATQKLLDDAQIDPEAWLAGKVAPKFGRDEATAFVTGDGNGKPRGFLTYADGVPTKGAWKVIERKKTGVDANFAASNKADIFMDLIGLMKDDYLNGAIFAMNRFTRSETRKLKNAVDGTYLLAMDFSQGIKQTIFGYPVVAFNDMPNYNVADALAVAFGNFGVAYQIVDRIGIRVLRDPYTAKPFVKFYTTKRVGGDVINHEAIKLAQFGD